MKEQHYVSFIKKFCKGLGIRVYFPRSDQVKADGSECAGFFDDDQMLLSVARYNPCFFTVLVHEFCHVLQWLEKCPEWVEFEIKNRTVCVDSWLNNPDHPSEGIEEAIISIRELEADCERRAVRLLKYHDFGVDVENYIREANAYVHFHNLMITERVWVQKSFSEIKEFFKGDSVESDFSVTSDFLLDKLRICAYEDLPVNEEQPESDLSPRELLGEEGNSPLS